MYNKSPYVNEFVAEWSCSNRFPEIELLLTGNTRAITCPLVKGFVPNQSLLGNSSLLIFLILLIGCTLISCLGFPGNHSGKVHTAWSAVLKVESLGFFFLKQKKKKPQTNKQKTKVTSLFLLLVLNT